MPKPESKPTKALTVFLTGSTAWAGMYLPKAVAGAIAVVTATLLVFLVPNNAKGSSPDLVPGATPWNPPPLQGDAGVIDGGGLVLLIVGFLLGVLSAHAHVLGL